MECPKNYSLAEGDVFGNGLVECLKKDSIDDCATECEDSQECYSFLYSPSMKHCKLMKEREPNSSTTPGPDYVFCIRNIIRNSFLILNSKIWVGKFNLYYSEMI